MVHDRHMDDDEPQYEHEPEPDEAADPEDVGAERTDLDDLTSDLGPPVDVGTFPLMDAILLAGHLRSIGIPAVSENDVADGPYRSAPGMGGASRVFVRPEDLERARDEARRIAEGPGGG